MTPRTTLEFRNHSATRLECLKQIVDESKYSIHDLSEIKYKPEAPNSFARMNMPFEIGLDCGKTYYGDDCHRKTLILADAAHDYKIALSDLSGIDASVYNNTQDLISEVRSFFYANKKTKIIEDAKIWDDYNTFTSMKLYTNKKFKMNEFCNVVLEYLSAK